jgi:hypothetical protein
MTTKRVFHVAELRGGPRDGERIVMDGEVSHGRTLTMTGLAEADVDRLLTPLDEPTDGEPPKLLIGAYVYDNGPTQAAEVSESKLHDDAPYVFAHARKHMRPTGYVWQGWHDA